MSLYSFVKSQQVEITEAKAQYLASRIGLAIEHLHDLGIVLRDLDASCILMNEGARNNESDGVFPRIQSLKKAIYLGIDEKTVGVFGNILYRAPEVIQGKQYDNKADVWSFGVIIFYLLTGKMVFDPKTVEEATGQPPRYSVEDLIKLSKPKLGILRELGYCHLSVQLLTSMFEKDPTKRPNMEQVMKHHWFKQNLDFKTRECRGDYFGNQPRLIRKKKGLDQSPPKKMVSSPEVAIRKRSDIRKSQI